MPSITDIIDTIATPPLAAMQQVRDTNGPFGPGDHSISQFHTDGAFLLPAGNYDVSGTYGCLVIPTVFPPQAGFTVGFNGIIGGQDQSENNFHDRIAQLILYHQLPITGAWIPMERFESFYSRNLFLWPAYLGSGGQCGLHVFPNFSVDLFWMCVL